MKLTLSLPGLAGLLHRKPKDPPPTMLPLLIPILLPLIPTLIAGVESIFVHSKAGKDKMDTVTQSTRVVIDKLIALKVIQAQPSDEILQTIIETIFHTVKALRPDGSASVDLTKVMSAVATGIPGIDPHPAATHQGSYTLSGTLTPHVI